ncbi:MAG: hypothetical protein HFI31_09890 [Lachnospiraceae bacterium]|nr:hypothetical protein [Lachnospiraceae bacterium]
MMEDRGATNEDVNVIREMAGTEFTFSDHRQRNQQAVGSYYSYTLFIYGFLVAIALITLSGQGVYPLVH